MERKIKIFAVDTQDSDNNIVYKNIASKLASNSKGVFIPQFAAGCWKVFFASHVANHWTGLNNPGVFFTMVNDKGNLPVS